MITLNDSNIDFDINSSNSILLTEANNIVIRTKTYDRITILEDGNVGVGTATNLTKKLHIEGEMLVSELITANTITASGLITGNAGITVPFGKTITSFGNIYANTMTTTGLITANTITTSGLITGNAGIKVPFGQTITSLGNIYANTMTTTGLITANNITASGLITGNAGITVPVGQTLISEDIITANVINASGLITGNAGITVPAGQILTSAGGITANTITASGLITGNAGITVPVGKTITSAGTITANVINASGLITGNAGITVPVGQTITSAGTITANVINASGLITGNAGITVPLGQTITSFGNILANTMTTLGLITANAGITVPDGQTITSAGTITANVINASGLISLYKDTTNTSILSIINNNITGGNVVGIPSIEFIRGIAGDAYVDYKIGNYNGDFKVISSVSGVNTDRFAIQNSGNTQFNNTSGVSIATILNNGNLRVAGSLITDSDIRIKKDVEDIDLGSALQMILAVQPKTYRYIDDDRRRGSGSNGSGCVYGFIAQQIKDVIPEATLIQKEFLPNIMKWVIRDKNRVYLDLTGYGDLRLNEGTYNRKINIRFKNGGGYNFDILEVNEEYFVIDTVDKHNEEVFVYGYEVSDFHKLTKDYIYTLNVSATQELHRKIALQEERIKALEEKLERVIGLNNY